MLLDVRIYRKLWGHSGEASRLVLRTQLYTKYPWRRSIFYWNSQQSNTAHQSQQSPPARRCSDDDLSRHWIAMFDLLLSIFQAVGCFLPRKNSLTCFHLFPFTTFSLCLFPLPFNATGRRIPFLQMYNIFYTHLRRIAIIPYKQLSGFLRCRFRRTFASRLDIHRFILEVNEKIDG